MGYQDTVTAYALAYILRRELCPGDSVHRRLTRALVISRPTRTLRGHQDKLVKPVANTVVCKNFSHRVIDPWNNLPDEVISAPTVRISIDRLRALPQGEEG